MNSALQKSQYEILTCTARARSAVHVSGFALKMTITWLLPHPLLKEEGS